MTDVPEVGVALTEIGAVKIECIIFPLRIAVLAGIQIDRQRILSASETVREAAAHHVVQKGLTDIAVKNRVGGFAANLRGKRLCQCPPLCELSFKKCFILSLCAEGAQFLLVVCLTVELPQLDSAVDRECPLPRRHAAGQKVFVDRLPVQQRGKRCLLEGNGTQQGSVPTEHQLRPDEDRQQPFILGKGKTEIPPADFGNTRTVLHAGADAEARKVFLRLFYTHPCRAKIWLLLQLLVANAVGDDGCKTVEQLQHRFRRQKILNAQPAAKSCHPLIRQREIYDLDGDLLVLPRQPQRVRFENHCSHAVSKRLYNYSALLQKGAEAR